MGRSRVVLYRKVDFWHAFFFRVRRTLAPKLDSFSSGFGAPWFQQSRHAPLFVMLTLTAILCGCSASNVIGLYAADYRDTTANAGDAQLLLNILRAKDNVPIHFYDLAIIHGSIQLTAGAGGSVPFELNNSATPGTIVPAFSAQSAPSFDVSTSDTQDFTRGILSQIEPTVVKALFDQGVDPRIMMLLFFSRYSEPIGLKYGPNNVKVLLNTMACDRSTRGNRPELGCRNQVYDYLDKMDRLLAKATAEAGLRPPLQAKIQANIYSALRPLGAPLGGAWNLKDSLGDLSKLDVTRYSLIGTQLFSISEPRLAICYENAQKQLVSLFPWQYPNAACTQKVIIDPRPPTIANFGLSLRSTYDIIEFLGQVLRFQQEKGNNRCLTLTGKTEEERQCDTGEVLFQVNAPVGTPVIGTRYDGAWYALYDRRCDKNHQQPCDYSIEVLAILEILLNENRSAKDIIATPRVQVVQ